MSKKQLHLYDYLVKGCFEDLKEINDWVKDKVLSKPKGDFFIYHFKNTFLPAYKALKKAGYPEMEKLINDYVKRNLSRINKIIEDDYVFEGEFFIQGEPTGDSLDDLETMIYFFSEITKLSAKEKDDFLKKARKLSVKVINDFNNELDKPDEEALKADHPGWVYGLAEREGFHKIKSGDEVSKCILDHQSKYFTAQGKKACLSCVGEYFNYKDELGIELARFNEQLKAGYTDLSPFDVETTVMKIDQLEFLKKQKH